VVVVAAGAAAIVVVGSECCSIKNTLEVVSPKQIIYILFFAL
jgi:hypothetical protein